MNTITRHALSAYNHNATVGAACEADPHRLIAMLYDGALTAIADARYQMTLNSIEGRGHAISKAISIVDQGLRYALDEARGGELATRLGELYRYICSCLMRANLRGETAGLDEAAQLLTELQDGWNTIGSRSNGSSATASADR